MVPPTAPAPAPDNVRPDGTSIAIGIGYGFPTSLETPNLVSVRFRLASGLTFEPQVALQSVKHTVDTGTAMDATTTVLRAAALVRYPLVSHGHVDLEFLGAARLESIGQDPSSEAEDDKTTTTTTALAYGVAVTTWFSKHWQLSMSATNNLLAFTKVRQEMGPQNVLVTSDTTFGLVFDPSVFLMVHLYH